MLFFFQYILMRCMLNVQKIILHVLFGLTKTKNATIFWYSGSSLTHTIRDEEFTDRDLNLSQSSQIHSYTVILTKTFICRQN